jgi:hypothetical protein
MVANRPKPSVRPLGGFESWTNVIGGILEVSGIPGFLGNLNEFYSLSDEENTDQASFVQAWGERYADSAVGVMQLMDVNTDAGDILDLGQGTERSRKTKLGQLLQRIRGRQFHGLKVILAGHSHHAKQWKLIRAKGTEMEPIKPISGVGEPGEPLAALPENNFMATAHKSDFSNGETGSPGSPGSQNGELDLGLNGGHP